MLPGYSGTCKQTRVHAYTHMYIDAYVHERVHIYLIESFVSLNQPPLDRNHSQVTVARGSSALALLTFWAGSILKHSPSEKRLLVVPHHPAQAYRNTDPPAASRHRTRTKAKHITSERHAVWLPSSLLLLSQSFQSHSLTHQGLWLLAQSQFQILGGLCVGHLSNTPRPMILDSFS